MRRLTLIPLVFLTACSASVPRAISSDPADPPATTVVSAPSSPSDVVAEVQQSEPDACAEPVQFEFAPVDLDAVEIMVPFGLMIDAHVTPVDHQYFQNFKDPDRRIEVYSPGAGTVVDIQHMGQIIVEGEDPEADDYRLVIEHQCGISSIFIHIPELAPKLATVAPPLGESARVSVPVDAGELIGVFTRNVDYNLVDLGHTVEGLLVPERYSREPWKIHVPDTLQYFVDPVREAMIAKSPRVEEPFAGEFAYDIDGRLVGNWFQEGTNGYAGSDPQRYGAGHLSVAYDLFDPSQVVVSIGTFREASAQFGVRGNGPDPAAVTVASGMVLYELVDYDYYFGDERWDRVSLVKGIRAVNSEEVRGVVLFQLLDDRRLRVETFPGKTATEVDGFTEAALIYER
jgi:hypothetical protein